jgi:ABC-2 type transport system ATP-binding protein
VTVSGPTAAVAAFTEGREVLHVERMSAFSRATVADGRQAADADHARRLGVELEPVSLQDLVVRTTNAAARPGAAAPGPRSSAAENTPTDSEGALR